MFKLIEYTNLPTSGTVLPDAPGRSISEEFGEALEHDVAELLEVDDRNGATVVAADVVADADRDQFHFAEALDVVDHLAQVSFK